jgi:hypothetical protein
MISQQKAKNDRDLRRKFYPYKLKQKLNLKSTKEMIRVDIFQPKN